MRGLIVILLIHFSQTTIAQQLQEENWVKYNLNGKVKSFTETTHEMQDNKAPVNKTIIVFNHDGNISRRDFYTNNNLMYVREYSYTNTGYSYISKSKHTVKGQDSWSVSPPRAYSFNDKRHIEETKGGNEPHMIGFYNNKGETDSVILYTKTGTRIQKIIYRYDRGGNIIEANVYNGNDTTSKRYSYLLDNQGRRLLEQSYDMKKVLKSVISHKYDEHGNEIELHISSSMPNDSLDIRMATVVHIYKYKYDDKYNWIYREEFTDEGKLKSVTERKITYY